MPSILYREALYAEFVDSNEKTEFSVRKMCLCGGMDGVSGIVPGGAGRESIDQQPTLKGKGT